MKMLFAPNRVELTLDCNSDKFSKLQNKAYYANYTLANDGFEIEYHDSTYKKKIKLVVGPATLLGNDSTKSWIPTDDNTQKLIRKLNKYIDRSFGSKYNLDDFTLTCVDIGVQGHWSYNGYLAELNVSPVTIPKNMKLKYSRLT